MRSLWLVFIVVVCFSCGKEESDLYGFNYLDIEDAYGLVIGKYTATSDNSYVLFKLNKTDMLEGVKYLNEGKNVVKPLLSPVVAYNLNDSYFLLTFRKDNQTVLESFLIRRFDGYARHLPKAVIAERAGLTDYRTDALRSDRNSIFYYTNSNGNWKLDLHDIDNPVIEEVFVSEVLDNNFSIDYMGNLLTDKKVILSSGASADLQWRNSAYTFPVKSYINHMYYIFRNGDSIQCSRIDVSTSAISEEKLYPSILLNESESAFVHSHPFPGFNKNVVTLSSAILTIEGTSVANTDLSAIDVKHITSSQNSTNYCYITGDDRFGSRIFARIDFKPAQPRYTQILAPGEFNIHNFSVSPDGNLVFSANKINGGKKVFGFIPLSGANWIFDDDEGVDDIQVLIR